jgi:ABC-type multidrug transport system ATPase subunit
MFNRDYFNNEENGMGLIKRVMLACVCLLLAAACEQGGGSAKKLAFVTNNASDFWTIARRGCEKADAELPEVTVEFRIPSDGTAAEQKRIIDDLLAKGIDGIAISPVDPLNQTQLINDVSRQALVFTQDSDAPNSNRSCYVGTDNVAAGRQAAALIKEALPQGGKIMLFVGKLDARILIMDEPTSSLTLSETARLLEVVKDLRAHGVGIIYITHRLGEVQEIADRAVVLRDGANAGSLARAEINHDNMVRLMVGRDLESFYQHPKVEKTPGYFEVESLRTTRYPDEQVSFNVGKGEILGVAGLVGAGRSEAAQAIFGVDRAVDARLKLGAQPVQIDSPRDAIRNGIYLVPEDRRIAGLITDITIRENVTLPSLDRYAPAGLISFDKERENAKLICGKLNVKAPSVEVKAADLSGGNQQKLVLAKWLALEPKVLIFDEPTRGIDVGAKAEIYELMRNLAESGVAIIMIGSDMEEVLQISDRVAVMHEGRVTGILSRDRCSEENIMRLAVGGGEQVCG